MWKFVLETLLYKEETVLFITKSKGLRRSVGWCQAIYNIGCDIISDANVQSSDPSGLTQERFSYYCIRNGGPLSLSWNPSCFVERVNRCGHFMAWALLGFGKLLMSFRAEHCEWLLRRRGDVPDRKI